MSTEWLQEARDAVDGFVAGLQAGIDSAGASSRYQTVHAMAPWLVAGQNTPIRPKP